MWWCNCMLPNPLGDLGLLNTAHVLIGRLNLGLLFGFWRNKNQITRGWGLQSELGWTSPWIDIRGHVVWLQSDEEQICCWLTTTGPVVQGGGLYNFYTTGGGIEYIYVLNNRRNHTTTCGIYERGLVITSDSIRQWKPGYSNSEKMKMNGRFVITNGFGKHKVSFMCILCTHSLLRDCALWPGTVATSTLVWRLYVKTWL